MYGSGEQTSYSGYEHSWKKTLREIGKQIRKLLGQIGPAKYRRRRAGYTRFLTDEERQIRLRQSSLFYVLAFIIAASYFIYNLFANIRDSLEKNTYASSQVLLEKLKGWRESSTICPPGLHSLMHLDRVFIDREPDGIEVLRQWHSEKRYRVLNGTTGDQVYLALEESSECARCCLGKCHPWNMHIMDHNQHEVLRISRALRCDSCCFPCCMQEVTVRSNGELLGSVTQNWNIWRPSFTVRDADDVPVLLVKGPICLCCAGEVDFLIKSIDKQHSVGVITKKWSGLAREFFKDGNSFGVCFPVDLDVKIKAVLIGACFLIDFVYFEEQSNMRRLSKPRRLSY
ncbi:hypothetical protein QAD02_019905 [Eretmocerus hayati]|uniref:Uncharacterized protein n=1 Tax=Eretmocerus hayati TaxID=131215 RepID=A0ACC2PKW9_9HYME|nr:hypothetical protein QAD02_019905 [Eretmocerus hayati]